MSAPLTIGQLRSAPLDALSRNIEERLSAKLAPHRIGDPWPGVTVNDWCALAGLVLRLREEIDRLLAHSHRADES